MNDSKKLRIKETLKNTKSRRDLLDCKVYELKLDKSHLSKRKLENLNLLFTECKWLYNHILSQSNIFDVNTKVNIVNALDKDRKPVIKELSIIGSQIKQSIHSRMMDSIRGLEQLKKNGFNVGKLKFKSRINSVPLKQFNTTYKFHPLKSNYVKIQNIKGYFKVNGIKQIPKNTEFADAKLIKRNKDFFLHLTCFGTKQVKLFPEKETGIDFGIENSITLANGEKHTYDFPESKRTRKLRRLLSRKQGSKKKSKKSKSYLRNLSLLNKSIDKTNNQKIDATNKIVSKITKTYETICVQDESIKKWKDENFGKKVHNSILGGIMKGLKRKAHTLKIVDKYTPTSQLCLGLLPNGSRCMRLNKFELKDRTYFCECGNVQERDPHSANVILEIGTGRVGEESIRKVLGERKHSKILMEGMTSFDKGNLARVDKPFPMKSEAHEFIRG